MAEVQVELPASLARLFPGAPRRLEVEAASVAQAVLALDQRWPGMRDRICDSTPAIRRHLRIFVDGEVAGLATPLRPGAEVLVMTAISGG
ncbi:MULTISPECIES: MoaD/ThiS family protein [Roseomonadaceae]|uniref:MoaD/ThiS family protein n=1 Tax=Falsiroseomonas oleicola TaxID=2801474 RepID=A0ABS6H1K8_9PROT|nr:MoaD/ThiS family protein [Roseomonas oleicola]MBU8542542.1 MoaD/ThiS family protein [Roseomonas oleicola]